MRCVADTISLNGAVRLDEFLVQVKLEFLPMSCRFCPSLCLVVYGTYCDHSSYRPWIAMARYCKLGSQGALS